LIILNNLFVMAMLPRRVSNGFRRSLVGR